MCFTRLYLNTPSQAPTSQYEAYAVSSVFLEAVIVTGPTVRNQSRSKHKEKIQANIKEIYDKSKKIYGAPKITHILNQKGFQVSQKTVSNYMQEMGIKAWYRKHYTRTTFSVDFSDRLKNLLHRQFNPERPDAVWCTDITYIWTYQMDLFI